MFPFHRYLLPLVIVSVTAALIRPVRNMLQNNELKETNDKIQKYLFVNNDLYGQDKPKIWVHVKNDVNARKWNSFGSRKNKNTNQPYIEECIKSIILHCKDDFNVIIITDDSFHALLPDWKIKLEEKSGVELSRYRMIAMAKVLYRYGGISMPPSFLCYKSPIDMVSEKPIVFSMLNRTRNIAINKQEPPFIANPEFIGCKKECTIMKDYIAFLETYVINHFRESEEDVFLGIVSAWCAKYMFLLDPRITGVSDVAGRPIIIDELLGEVCPIFARNALGIYFDETYILTRTHYSWFSVISVEEIMESDLGVKKMITIARGEQD